MGSATGTAPARRWAVLRKDTVGTDGKVGVNEPSSLPHLVTPSGTLLAYIFQLSEQGI